MENTSPTTPTLDKKLIPGMTVAGVVVLILMALSLGLHLYNIDSLGNANQYYTAAVKSMLQSWSNFFFVAAEPGGSVSVDKPPLGLWIEAIFAYFLGVSGFSVSLPNILAGVFSIPLLYSMVKRYSGALAGLVAAFVMSITPVFLATNRDNTMDGMLVFTLLLAAWAFIHATETGRMRWLMLGAFIVGLGFNIKMLQAFLPLPAFYALYFFGSKEGWIQKTIKLGLASLLLVAVSLSWAIAVDLTPAENRPYIGSSDNNTVMGLIFGHNGISRLENSGPGGGNNPSGGGNRPEGQQPQQPQPSRQGNAPQQALDACSALEQGDSCSFDLPNGNHINGSCIVPPNTDQLACAPQGAGGRNPQGQQPPTRAGGGNPQNPGMGGAPGQGGGTQFSQETGSPSVFRFFTAPLSKQMSWVLPFALIGLVLAFIAAKVRFPLESGAHKALVLWGGWLVTCLVFFSMVSGIFHAYYAIMLAPPLGAMVGIGFALLWDWSREKKWASVVLAVSTVVTVAFQFFATAQYNEWSWWFGLAGLLLAIGLGLMFFARKPAYLVLLASMLVIPFYWSVMTVATSSNNPLPSAYTGQNVGNGPARPGMDGGNRPEANSTLEDYLQANTQDVEYLLAVPSSHQGASLVISTGRPVLYMGGFGGQDSVVSVQDLSEMVANGELRYILYGDERGFKAEIADWLRTSCRVVNDISATQGMTLYQCQ